MTTAPAVPPGSEELREALAEALRDVVFHHNTRARVVATLLPVVLADRERHARAFAAEKLRRVEELAARFPSDVSVINAGRVRRALAGDAIVPLSVDPTPSEAGK